MTTKRVKSTSIAIPKTREPIRRRSNRKYEERTCLQTGKKFIPTNKRQKFIDAQARIDYNNDKRAVVGKEINLVTKSLLHNKQILIQGEKRLKELGKNAIGRDILLFYGYVFNAYSTITTNKVTGKQIYWSLDYGIEGYDNQKETFIIHNKTK